MSDALAKLEVGFSSVFDALHVCSFSDLDRHLAQRMATAITRRHKKYTVEEVVSMLEHEDFIDAEVVITPPGEGPLSDEDSGAEDDPDVTHFSSRQLSADAEFRINYGDRRFDSALEEAESNHLSPQHQNQVKVQLCAQLIVYLQTKRCHGEAVTSNQKILQRSDLHQGD